LRNQLVCAWVAQVDDGEPRRLTDPAWEVLDARWLPDGRHIAVVADAEPDAGMRRLSECAAAWRIAVDDSTEPASLAELPGGIAAVRPSPDGTRVAVVGKDYPRQPSWADNHLYVTDPLQTARRPRFSRRTCCARRRSRMPRSHPTARASSTAGG